ncbi:MAG: hypothetical protein ACLUI3_00265 [Christensenellales bacterium]
MRLIYQGTDITDSVDIISAVHRDVSDRRCDGLERRLTMRRRGMAGDPNRRHDTADGKRIQHGTLYLTIVPERQLPHPCDGRKSSTRRKAWASYADKRLRTSSSNARQRAAWRADYTALKEADISVPHQEERRMRGVSAAAGAPGGRGAENGIRAIHGNRRSGGARSWRQARSLRLRRSSRA